MFGNGNGKEWEKPYGNLMGMGIGYKIGNGKEWESIEREWEEWECKKAIPGHLYTEPIALAACASGSSY